MRRIRVGGRSAFTTATGSVEIRKVFGFCFRIDFVRKGWKSYLKSSNHNFHHYLDSLFPRRYKRCEDPASLFGANASKGARPTSYLQLSGLSRRTVLIVISKFF